MVFARESMPSIKDVINELKDQGIEIKTYKMNITGPYGGLDEVTCIVNSKNFDFIPLEMEPDEPVTTPMLQYYERRLGVKLLESNVVSIKEKKKE